MKSTGEVIQKAYQTEYTKLVKAIETEEYDHDHMKKIIAEIINKNNINYHEDDFCDFLTTCLIYENKKLSCDSTDNKIKLIINEFISQALTQKNWRFIQTLLIKAHQYGGIIFLRILEEIEIWKFVQEVLNNDDGHMQLKLDNDFEATIIKLILPSYNIYIDERNKTTQERKNNIIDDFIKRNVTSQENKKNNLDKIKILFSEIISIKKWHLIPHVLQKIELSKSNYSLNFIDDLMEKMLSFYSCNNDSLHYFELEYSRKTFFEIFENLIKTSISQGNDRCKKVELILNNAVVKKSWFIVEIILKEASGSPEQEVININEILKNAISNKQWRLVQVILKVAILRGNLGIVQEILAHRDERGIPHVDLRHTYGKQYVEDDNYTALLPALTTQPVNKDIVQTLLNVKDKAGYPVLDINHSELNGMTPFTYVISDQFPGSMPEKMQFFKMIVEEVRGEFGELIAKLYKGHSPLIKQALALNDIHFLEMLFDIREVNGSRALQVNYNYNGKTALDFADELNCDLDIKIFIRNLGGMKAKELPEKVIYNNYDVLKGKFDRRDRKLQYSVERLKYLYGRFDVDTIKIDILSHINENFSDSLSKETLNECIQGIEKINVCYHDNKLIDILAWAWMGLSDENLEKPHFWLDEVNVNGRKKLFLDNLITQHVRILNSGKSQIDYLTKRILSPLSNIRTDIVFSDDRRKFRTTAIRLLQKYIIRYFIIHGSVNNIEELYKWKYRVQNYDNSALYTYLYKCNSMYGKIFSRKSFNTICSNALYLTKPSQIIAIINSLNSAADLNLPERFTTKIVELKKIIKDKNIEEKSFEDNELTEKDRKKNLSSEEKLKVAIRKFEKNSQNSHTTEVVTSVSNSVKKLQMLYKNYDKEKNLEALGEYINHLSEKGDKEKLEKDTALQYLNSIKENNFKDTDTDLTLSDIVALVWEGIIDNTEQARPQDVPQLTAEYIEIRKSALVERLVANQTMYHDSSKETICFKGALNNIVDALDKAHPAVILVKGGFAASMAADMLPSLLLKEMECQPIREQRKIISAWKEENEFNKNFLTSITAAERNKLLEILVKRDEYSIVLQFKKNASVKIDEELERTFGSVVLPLQQRKDLVNAHADYPMLIVHKELEVVIQLINEISTESASPHKKEAIERLQGLAKDAYGERDRSFQEEYEFLFAKYKDFTENFDTLECYVKEVSNIDDGEDNNKSVAVNNLKAYAFQSLEGSVETYATKLGVLKREVDAFNAFDAVAQKVYHLNENEPKENAKRNENICSFKKVVDLLYTDNKKTWQEKEAELEASFIFFEEKDKFILAKVNELNQLKNTKDNKYYRAAVDHLKNNVTHAYDADQANFSASCKKFDDELERLKSLIQCADKLAEINQSYVSTNPLRLMEKRSIAAAIDTAYSCYLVRGAEHSQAQLLNQVSAIKNKAVKEHENSPASHGLRWLLLWLTGKYRAESELAKTCDEKLTQARQFTIKK